MGCEVYANGMTIACKAADGKTIAAMPDVCLSPPSPPAGPVPIPYPNTAIASDTTDGSKTVQINGQEVMLKDSSSFKKSTGDEAATKSLGMGVVTHQIQGKVNFVAWSMDVKFESANVPRHLDLTLHNEMSSPANTGPWPYMDMAAMGPDHPCLDDLEKEYKACEGYQPYGTKNPCLGLGWDKPSQETSSSEAMELANKVAANKCLAARRCTLQPYEPPPPTKKETRGHGCCPPQTPHHLIEASALHEVGRGGSDSTPLPGVSSSYREGKAPCVCAEGTNQHVGTHGMMHTFQSAAAAKSTQTMKLSDGSKVKATTYGQAKHQATEAFQKTFPESRCNPDCLKAQLDHYHNEQGINDTTPIKAVETGAMPIDEAEFTAHLRQQAAAGVR
jgi:uncharacterized protein DUF4150/HNH/endonuclease VII toxin of polymorphic toxin system